MHKYNIINLIDKLFICISIFLVVFAWINFYIRDLWTTFIFSLIFTFAIVFILFTIINKKQTKKSLSKKKFENINKYFYYFKLLNKKQKIELMQKFFPKDYLCSTSKNSFTFIKDEKKHTMIFCTHHTKITKEILLNVLDEFEFKTDCLDVICTEYDRNINTKIFTDKEINLIDKIELFEDYFEKYNIYPSDSNINLKTEKMNFLDILQNFFLPHKSKQYFICGLILIFSSIILPFHTYYLIFGSILIMFSIICKLMKNFKN